MSKKIIQGLSYDRVSSFGQVSNPDGSIRDDASPDAQRKRCINHVEHLSKKYDTDYEIIEFISDVAYSGKNTDRPGYQHMLSRIASGRIKFVIAAELSRLSRSVTDFLALVALCQKYGVSIIILGLDLDTSTPFGKMMIVILVSLAQFERETTGLRVRENALVRLIKDGKINGTAEILGLDCDPDRKGHYIRNEEEILRLEKILRIYLKVPSKKALLKTANEQGLGGKDSVELTPKMVETILGNVQWRYRGLWRANRQNEDVDTSNLPESKQYKIVKLPHGPLLEKELLDAVEEKLRDMRSMRKKTGVENFTYLLSCVLKHEDGSKFTGAVAKNRQYRYYYNQKHKIRIPCANLEKFVMSKIKQAFFESDVFSGMLADMVRRRQEGLPKIDAEIRIVESELKKLDASNENLRQKLLNLDTQKLSFMTWLENEVEKQQLSRANKEKELERLLSVKAEALKEVKLDDLAALTKDYLKTFDTLTGTERRNEIEKLVECIVVKSGNKLELNFNFSPLCPSRGQRWKNSSDSLFNGGSDGTRTHDLRRDRASL